MKFFAHTAEDDQGNRLPEEKWQPLSEHLRNVADFAKEFATPLDLADEAELCKEKANRVLPRLAIPESGQSRQLNVSIRALLGEHIQLNHTETNFAIDKTPNQCIIAIDLTALKNVNDEQIMNMMVVHVQKCSLPMKTWFAGACASPRRHPWDEQELLFSTKAWIMVHTEIAQQAQRIAAQLFHSGFSKSPAHTDSVSVKYVFAYALNQESLN